MSDAVSANGPEIDEPVIRQTLQQWRSRRLRLNQFDQVLNPHVQACGIIVLQASMMGVSILSPEGVERLRVLKRVKAFLFSAGHKQSQEKKSIHQAREDHEEKTD